MPKKYAEKQKLKALEILAYLNGSLEGAAKEIGCCVDTINRWRKQYPEKYLEYCEAAWEASFPDILEIRAMCVARLRKCVETASPFEVCRMLEVLEKMNADYRPKSSGRSKGSARLSEAIRELSRHFVTSGPKPGEEGLV